MPQDQWPPVSWRGPGSVRRMPLPLTISKPKALIDGIKWAYLMKSTGICRMSSYQRLLFVSLPHRYSDFGRENKKTFSFYGYKLQDSLWNFSWVAFKLLAAFVWVELVLQLLNRCLIQLFFFDSYRGPPTPQVLLERVEETVQAEEDPAADLLWLISFQGIDDCDLLEK